MTLSHTLRLIAADTRERNRLENKRYGFLSYIKILLNPPALAVVVYRFQHWLHTSGWTFAADLLRRFNLIFFKTEIDSRAEISEHFMLLHANAIVIGPGARIGRNVYLVHHNSIAAGLLPSGNSAGIVTIEDNVVLGCGARILGDNLTIGHDSFIGAGAVVTESLPECSFHYAGPGEKNELS